MAWLTAAEIKSEYNFSLKDETDDAPIDSAKRLAAYDLKDWLKAEDFELAIGETAPTDEILLERYNRIVDAHALLTVNYVFLKNTQIRSGGSVKSERDGDVQIVSYYTPKELKEMRDQYKKEAQNLIAGFSVVDFSPQIETDVSHRSALPASVKVVADW